MKNRANMQVLPYGFMLPLLYMERVGVRGTLEAKQRSMHMNQSTAPHSPTKNRESTQAFAVIQTHIVRPAAGPAIRSTPSRKTRKMKDAQ